MGKLNLTIDLDNLTEKEREKFFKLVEKSKDEKPYNPFERVETNTLYCYINDCGEIKTENEVRFLSDIHRYHNCNYFNNKDFAEHQALRELLNRKLMKFSYENGGAEIKNIYNAVTIFYNPDTKSYAVNGGQLADVLTPLFISPEVAQRAIDEVVNPFLKEHPDFKWWE